MSKTNRRLRYIEADGFFDGVHLVSPDPSEAEITARFDRDVHQVRHDAVDAGKKLEAEVAVLEVRQPEVERHWRQLESETRGLRPEVAMPVVASLAAVVSIAGETLLLAPVMDGFGIPDRAWQAITAGTLVMVASGLLHLALDRIHVVIGREGTDRTMSSGGPAGSVATIALALFALLTISTLGWWRAGEMIFAADALRGEWAQFLHQNELLTRLCVTLLTLGLPFFAAASFEWGFARSRYAIEWRRASKSHVRLVHNIEVARKNLEAVTAKREHQISVLEQIKQTWLASYRENYQLGQRIGASRPGVWRVVLHIIAVVLLIAGCCVVVDSWLWQVMSTTGRQLLYTFVTLGFGGLYAYLALKAWERPTALQLYRQRAVVWRSPSGTSTSVSKATVAPAGAAPTTEASHGA